MSSTDINRCGYCGQPVAFGEEFCGNCGKRLNTSASGNANTTTSHTTKSQEEVKSASKGFQSLSDPFKIAIIGAIGTIIAAVISGIFLIGSNVLNRPGPSQTTPIVFSTTAPSPSQPSPSTTITPSPTPIPDPYPPQTGRIALSDPLKDNSEGNQWDNGVSTPYGNCNFEQDGVYHVFAIPNDYHRCAAEHTDFSNFAFAVTLQIVKGDCGGMIFRADAQSLSYYYFTICQNSTYNFAIYTTGSEKLIQNAVSNSNIHSGLGQANTIAVVAMNDTISLYVNMTSQAIYTASERNFTQGQIGLVSESDSNNPTDVAFQNAYVWVL